jgi:hypothetical protein
MFTSKCLVNLLELKKINQLNQLNKSIEQIKDVFSNESVDKLVLNVFTKTLSIRANINGSNEPDEYFINPNDNKLYKYDINGINPYLANGNFLIAISNELAYINRAYKVSNGDMQELCTFFDGTNFKLIIKGVEIKNEGTLILTDDYKIFVRIGNGWFGK